MSLQDKITDDQVAVDAAQAALDAANGKLATDTAALAAVQPHLSLLDQIEAELIQVDENVDEALNTALLSVQSSITPLIAQMRSLLSN